MWHFVLAASGNGHTPTLRVAGVAALLTTTVSEFSEPVCPSGHRRVTWGAHFTCWPHSPSEEGSPGSRQGSQCGGGAAGWHPQTPHTRCHACTPRCMHAVQTGSHVQSYLHTCTHILMLTTHTQANPLTCTVAHTHTLTEGHALLTLMHAPQQVRPPTHPFSPRAPPALPTV